MYCSYVELCRNSYLVSYLGLSVLAASFFGSLQFEREGLLLHNLKLGDKYGIFACARDSQTPLGGQVVDLFMISVMPKPRSLLALARSSWARAFCILTNQVLEDKMSFCPAFNGGIYSIIAERSPNRCSLNLARASDARD